MALENLIVFNKAYSLAMEVFDATKRFPVEERYSLIDQVRRSSRSVCANIGEGYRKRFTQKVSLQSWLMLMGSAQRQLYIYHLQKTADILMLNNLIGLNSDTPRLIGCWVL